jgi:hypothetical protein
MNAAALEGRVMRDVSRLLQDEERVARQLDEAIARETTLRRPEGDAALWLRQVKECDRKTDAFQHQQAAGLLTMDKLPSKRQEPWP